MSDQNELIKNISDFEDNGMFATMNKRSILLIAFSYVVITAIGVANLQHPNAFYLLIAIGLLIIWFVPVAIYDSILSKRKNKSYINWLETLDVVTLKQLVNASEIDNPSTRVIRQYLNTNQRGWSLGSAQ